MPHQLYCRASLPSQPPPLRPAAHRLPYCGEQVGHTFHHQPVVLGPRRLEGPQLLCIQLPAWGGAGGGAEQAVGVLSRQRGS